MIKFSSLLLLLLFSFDSFASCDGLLRASSEEWLSQFNDHWAEQKAQFSSRQVKAWSEAMEHLTEDLKETGESSSSKDQLLKAELEKAVQKLPEIYKSFKELEASDKKAGYFKEAFQATWAALSVHAHELVDAKSKEKDYSRYFAILKVISEFDSKKSKFSFYKIRRAVQGRFSIKEFNNCLL